MSIETKLIVVLGATGAQGGSVARLFASLPGWRVRALTRSPDPTRPAAKALLAHAVNKNIELARADLDDPSSLDVAFSGAHAIYAATDFWQFWGDADAQRMAAEQKIPLPAACLAREVTHGRNAADAALRVLKREGKLQAYVWSTLSDTKGVTKGEITENYHFDGKVLVERYIRNELPELAAVARYLMVGFYMMNWRMGAAFRPAKVCSLLAVDAFEMMCVSGADIESKQPDGSFVLPTLKGPNGPTPVPFVHPPHDCGYYTRALLDAPPGTTMLGHSGRHTIEYFCALLSKKAGVSVQAKYVTAADVRSMFPGDIGREIAASVEYSQRWRYEGVGDDNLKEPAELGVDVSKLMTLEQYVDTEDWRELLESEVGGMAAMGK